MEYRIYWIGPDDRIKQADYLDCASDVDAETKTRGLMRSFPVVEVWQGTRRVLRLSTDEAVAVP